MPKSIISGPEALTKLLAGINRIADPVKATLGPSGKNTIYERLGTNLPVSTRDGVTVAEQIEAIDPHEQMGVALIQGVAHEAVDQSGDGTTTATLLAQAIFGEGVKAITVGANPVAIKRGIEKATRFVLECLRNMAIPVSGDMLRQVATISANNDSFLGGLIADAIEKAGPDGVVTVEVSQSPESSLQVVDGLQFAAGYILPEFVTNPARNECVLEDVAIYLHEKKLATILPMRPLLNKLKEAGKSLLVIAEDVTDEALAVLAISASKGQFRCAAIRTPGGVDHLHDIAALTGARVHTELLGVRPENVGMDFLGSAKRVIVKAQSTTIIADSSKDGLEKKLEELRAQVADATDEGQRLRLQARLARLAGGVVIIKVGASTELEMHEKRDRVEDAMHATRGAQKEGVVPGGGIALLRCQQIPTQGWSEDERAGALIVSKACHAPLRTLAENCGESPEYIDKQVHQSVDTSTGMYSVFGWDARTNKFGDMIEMGILDPLRVVRVALESASSVAALSLITNCLVANERK